MGYLGGIIISICVLAAASLFFSANSVALRLFSRVKLLEAFKNSKKKQSAEKRTDNLTENTEKMILACSIYRVVFNAAILLLLLVITGRGDILTVSDYILTFVIALSIFLVFSVAIPHAWAKYAGEKLLRNSYGLLKFFTAMSWPILRIFDMYDSFVRRLAGVVTASPDQQQEEKQEEFLNGLEQQKIEGVVDEEEQEMIENVLELSDTTADEIMTPRTDIVAIDVNSDLQTVLKIIDTAGHSRVPVYEENIDNIIGLVYAKDLLTEMGKNPADFNLRAKLRQVYFVPETKLLRSLLHEFQNQKLHIAIVLDEYGGTAGIVTIEDILEELVGEITDEYESTTPKPIKKIDANTIDVDARTYIDDLNDQFDLNLPEEEDYDTIGGFVFSHLGYIPKSSETFEYENLKFTIVSAEARRVKRIRIKRT